MKAYKVTPRHSVVLREGTVFMTDPENVAGALQSGAVEEITVSALEAEEDQPETTQSEPESK